MCQAGALLVIHPTETRVYPSASFRPSHPFDSGFTSRMATIMDIHSLLPSSMSRTVVRLATLVLFLATVPHAAAQYTCTGASQTEEYLEFLRRNDNDGYNALAIPPELRPGPDNLYVIDLAFHEFREYQVFEDWEIREMVRVANSAFAGTGIQFRFAIEHYTIDDTLPLKSLASLMSLQERWTLLNTYVTPHAIDVFLIEEFEPASYLRGWGTYSLCSAGQGVILTKGATPYGSRHNGIDVESVWVHELGHYFDLIHPWEEWEDPIGSGWKNYQADCPGPPGAGSNCTRAGDFVCDTPAAPDITAYPGLTIWSAVCTYIEHWVVKVPTTSPDCGGVFYTGGNWAPPDGTNFMSNAPDNCRTQFTDGQRGRMQAALINFRPELYDCCRGGSPSMLDCDPNGEAAAGPGARVGSSADMAALTVDPETPFKETGLVAVVGAPHDQRVLTFKGPSPSTMAYDESLHSMPPSFGTAVSFDGRTLLVGAPDADPDDPYSGLNTTGMVIAWERDPVNESFGSLQILEKAPTGTGHPDFGSSIDHYGDWAVISSTDRSAGFGDPMSSFVSIYKRDAIGDWKYAQSLQYCTTAIGFGSDVAISGEWIVVGAAKYGDSCSPGVAGAVIVYQLQDGVWTFVQELQSTEETRSFGWSVDLWGDTLAVGAPESYRDGDDLGGSVYVFQRSGTEFQQVHSYDNPVQNIQAEHAFGWDVVVAQNAVLASDPGFLSETGIVYELQRTPYQEWECAGEHFLFPYLSGERYGSAIAATSGMMIAAAEGWDRYDCDGEMTAEDCGAVIPDSLLGLARTMEMTADATSISAANPVQVNMTIDFGPGAAGQTYWIVGNMTEESPGMDIFGITGPAVDSMPHVAFRSVHTPDLYFQNATSGGWTPLSQTSGHLDDYGMASVTFNWPPGFLQSSPLLPLHVTHTAVLMGDLHYETAPVEFTIVGEE